MRLKGGEAVLFLSLCFVGAPGLPPGSCRGTVPQGQPAPLWRQLGRKEGWAGCGGQWVSWDSLGADKATDPQSHGRGLGAGGAWDAVGGPS